MTMLVIRNTLSQNLAFRDLATVFFDKYVKNSKSDLVTIDFKGVISISRSFADQYAIRKRQSHKTIKEINVPENVRKMMTIVSDTKKTRNYPARVGIEPIKMMLF